MAIAYIIYSKSLDLYYVGHTIDLPNRLEEHNSAKYDGAFTTRAADWRIFHTIECASKTQAIAIENHIKRMRNRNYIKNFKKYPELSEKLLERFS